MQRRRHNNVLGKFLGYWGLLILLGFVAGIALPPTPAAAQDAGPTGTAFRGQSTFSQRCVQCHGPGGSGDGPMAGEMPVPLPDFTDPAYVQSRSPQAIFDIITDGRIENLMPPWGDALSEEERWDLTAFIWSLHLTSAEIDSGEQTFGGSCADCHGPDGAGSDGPPPVPGLAGDNSLQLTEQEWQAQVSADPHPRVEGVMENDLLLASTFARSFGLGFDQTSANLEGEGVIVVLAANGTTGEILANTPVELKAFDADGSVTTLEGMTDDQGMVAFESLSTEPIWVFMAQTMHDDYPFTSDVVQFDSTTRMLQLPLNVYESGATADDIRINRAHWVVSLENPHTLDVGELYSFVNTSDRIYTGEVGDDGFARVLRFNLPANAINVSFEGVDSEGRYVTEGDVVFDTLAMPPGSRQVLFRYSLPVEDEAATIEHPIAYPVDNLNLLAPDMGVTVDAPEWTQESPLQAQGGAFLNYTLESLTPGDSPRARIAGITAGIFSGNNQSQAAPNQQVIDPFATPGISGQPYLPFVVILLTVVVLGAGAVVLVRRQQQQAANVPEQRKQQRQALVLEIADLDDAYEAGEVAEADYQAQRRLLKAQLVALNNQSAA